MGGEARPFREWFPRGERVMFSRIGD